MNFRLSQNKRFLRTHSTGLNRPILKLKVMRRKGFSGQQFLSQRWTWFGFRKQYWQLTHLMTIMKITLFTFIRYITRLIPAVWIWPCSLWVSTCWTSRRRTAHGWTWTWSCSKPSLWFRYRWAHLSTVSFSLAKSTVTNMEQWWKSHSEFSYLNDWYNIKIFHIIQWS